MRYYRSPQRDNLKSVEGHRYYVILHKGLEHLWIGVSPGVLEPMPWEAEGQLHSVTLTTTVLAHLRSPVWTFYLEYIVLEGTQLPWKGRMEHLLELVSTSANFTKTYRKTVPATGPSATGQLFWVNSIIFLELWCILWGWEGLWEITQFMLFRLGRMELSLCRQLGGSL